ncbi:MAG: SGNH/GDSL hydrolase family protein [Bacteroidetes bacterium]|nr:MAG: SGNH/GDSL hydrolase family protein [Bacteroidota bacterium]
MGKIKIVLLFFTLLVCSSTDWQDSPDDLSKKSVRVLFVGNSLTYSNDLPSLVKKAARQKGVSIKTKMFAYPNYAIEDHWNDGVVQKEISRNNYDFVILQQGPSSQPPGRKMLMDYGKKFSYLCQEHDAQLCFFMVWPSLNYYHTFDGVIKNYKEAATMNNAVLCPVGEVWKAHFDSTENFDYYSFDGFHPSLKGSQVAAEVIVEHLFND